MERAVNRMSPQEREDRIKELEGYRDGWEAMIQENNAQLDKLIKLKDAGINLEEAIERAVKASDEFTGAKANIERAILSIKNGN
jgi:hypothetical protein